ncbi:MAG: hypothetical protein AAF656_04145 [Planctomycetota bacterium]
MSIMIEQQRGVQWVTPGEGESATAAITRTLAAVADLPSRVIGIGPDGPDDDGTWIVDETIRVPSHTTLLLNGARIVASSDMRGWLLRNEASFEPSGRDDMISVIGDGRSSLDGVAIHGHGKGGGGVLMQGVNGLWLQGFRIGQTAGWGLRAEDLADAHIRDINFFQTGGHPWQDGVHIVGPAERVVINGITGEFGDDVIAIDSALTHDRPGGPVRGVEVSNVTARNIHGAAIVRTIAAKGRPVEGVHISNLTLVNTPGKGSDAAIKIGWDGGKQIRDDWEWPTANEHKDITIENVQIVDWKGPVVCVYHPVRNLALRNITATHRGPFFFNLEHDVVGLTMERIRSNLIAESMRELDTKFLGSLVNGDVYRLGGEYGKAFVDTHLGAITFNQAVCSNVRLRDVELNYTGGNADQQWPAALRLSCGVTAKDIRLEDVRCNGYARTTWLDDDATIQPADDDVIELPTSKG